MHFHTFAEAPRTRVAGTPLIQGKERDRETERERERERERARDRERERERDRERMNEYTYIYRERERECLCACVSHRNQQCSGKALGGWGTLRYRGSSHRFFWCCES